MELSENCYVGVRVVFFIRDFFSTNVQDTEIQKELFKETAHLVPALRLATNLELETRKQLHFLNSQYVPQVNSIFTQRQTCLANTRPIFQSQPRVQHQTYQNCGLAQLINQKTSLLPKINSAIKCSLQNHFTRVCRKSIFTFQRITPLNINAINTPKTSENSVNPENYRRVWILRYLQWQCGRRPWLQNAPNRA